MLEVEIVVRQARQPGRVDEEPSYDQDGLVVRCGWVAKCSQIPGFVDEAKLQLEAPNKAMATNGGHRIRRPHGVGNARRSVVASGNIAVEASGVNLKWTAPERSLDGRVMEGYEGLHAIVKHVLGDAYLLSSYHAHFVHRGGTPTTYRSVLDASSDQRAETDVGEARVGAAAYPR